MNNRNKMKNKNWKKSKKEKWREKTFKKNENIEEISLTMVQQFLIIRKRWRKKKRIITVILNDSENNEKYMEVLNKKRKS